MIVFEISYKIIKMKKLIFLATFSLPLLVLSQTEKLEIPKVDMPKAEFPTIDLSIKSVPFDTKIL